MYYYEDYWNLMKKFDEKNFDRRVSTFMNREEQLRLEKARKWREIVLIKQFLLFLMTPLTLLAIVSFFTVQIFPIIPALSYL
jgi:hypothetical protein